jgi:hypothetical protein
MLENGRHSVSKVGLSTICIDSLDALGADWLHKICTLPALAIVKDQPAKGRSAASRSPLPKNICLMKAFQAV